MLEAKMVSLRILLQTMLNKEKVDKLQTKNKEKEKVDKLQTKNKELRKVHRCRTKGR